MRRFLTLAFLLVILALPLALTAQVINTFGPLNGNNVWTGTDQFTLGIGVGPITFSQLSSISTSTTLIYVSNATLGSSPCTAGGTGALAIYINGAWNCSFGTAGSGTLTQVITTLPITGGTCTTICTIGVNSATTSTTGVVELTGDFAGTATSPTVVNGAHITNSSITNSGLANPSLTVVAGTGLSGGGVVALGSSSTLNLANIGAGAGTCTNCNETINAQGQVTAYSSGSGGSGGGNPTLDNCTPDQTGYSFYNVTSLTQYLYASWTYVSGAATYINCTVYIPTAQTGATIALDIAANDSTSGHTANFQTCDEVINSGTINPSSALTCASAQTFTTTSTAYNRATLTFNVQSTLSNGSILIIRIAATTTGTAPTANMLVYPHFVL
jgi:hypothetical protein